MSFSHFLSQNDEYITKLITLVLNEKGSEEILFYDSQFMDNIMELIKNQKDMIEEQEESLKESVDFTTDRMINTLFKNELTRVEYLVTNYLRTRILKIQKYNENIMEKYIVRLSTAERSFLLKYCALVKKHMESQLSEIKDQIPKINIEPKLDDYIFFFILKRFDNVIVDDTYFSKKNN